MAVGARQKTLNKPKLMILGAGLCQVPLIEQARGMGFETLAVSIAGNYPGFQIADKAYEIDVREEKKILEIALREQIHGILTDQTDIPVPTVAYVAQQMGLPGIDYDCALRFTNKYKMRQLCEKLGIPVPRHVQATSVEEAREKCGALAFPVILKPVDSQGSRGVVMLNHPAEVPVEFAKSLAYSRRGAVILEEFVSGREVVVQGFVSDFRFQNLLLGDREYFEIPNLFIPKRTIFPSKLEPELQEKVLDLNSRLINGFGPKFGMTHSEYIVDTETGDIHLVETAIRGGGVFISSDLVPLACGVDPTALLIRLASGEKDVKIDGPVRLNRASGYLCFCLPHGVISAVQGMDELSSIPGVHKAYLQDFKVGQRTIPMTDKTERLGPILVSAKDRDALQKTIREVQNTLVIEVDTPEGIAGILW